jgi:hypothetical protein
MEDHGQGTNFSQFSPNSIADVFKRYKDVKTFGLDGFCHGPTPFVGGEIFNYDHQEYGTSIAAFTPQDKFFDEAREILKKKGIKRSVKIIPVSSSYVYSDFGSDHRLASVHWRHGDLLWKEPWAMLPNQMAEEVVEWLKVWRVTNKDTPVPWGSDKNVEEFTKFDGLFLATDNFMHKDVEEFKDIISKRMNIARDRVFTYDSSNPVKALFMDIALASMGNVFMYTNTLSFFSGYIKEYRYVKMGMSLKFCLPLEIVKEFSKTTNYDKGTGY